MDHAAQSHAHATRAYFLISVRNTSASQREGVVSDASKIDAETRMRQDYHTIDGKAPKQGNATISRFGNARGRKSTDGAEDPGRPCFPNET